MVNKSARPSVANECGRRDREEMLAESRNRPGARAANLDEPESQSEDLPRIPVLNLLDGRKEAILVHNGEDYRLRITSKGRLILTK